MDDYTGYPRSKRDIEEEDWRLESELARLRRDSEALGRVRKWIERNEVLVRGVDGAGEYWTNGFSAAHHSVKAAIAAAGCVDGVVELNNERERDETE